MKNYASRVLVEELSLGQNRLLEARILAPHVPPSGVVRSRIQGLLHNFQAQENDFEGWGLFQPRTSAQVRLLETASQGLVDAYLCRFPCWEVRLIRPLRGRSWLAHARQNKSTGPRGHKDWFNPCDGPMIVHLVEGGSAFAVCRARFDGRNLWYEGPAPNADPRLGYTMLRGLDEGVAPQNLRGAGLTALDRCAYSLQFLHFYSPSAVVAGRMGVQWIDCRGEKHTSSIIEKDLKVIGAGIRLTEDDTQFDPASLAGVGLS